MADRHLAFAFGVVFVAVILVVAVIVKDPTPFQMFVFRVVLALTAGGIGAVIPGLFEFNSPFIRAGGALALFAAVYSLNPPSLLTSPKNDKVNGLNLQGESALTVNNYDLALDLFNQALAEAPNWESHFGLARVAFRTKQYANALEQFKSVLEMKGGNDPSTEYQISLCLDGLGRYEEDLGQLKKIKTNSGNRSYYYTNAVYDEGAVNLILAFNATEANRPKLLAASEKAFGEFSEFVDVPKQWFFFEKACIEAMHSTENGLMDEKILSDISSALKDFGNTLSELHSERLRNKDLQLQILREMISGTYQRLPGYPVSCPPLLTLVKAKAPQYLAEL